MSLYPQLPARPVSPMGSVFFAVELAETPTELVIPYLKAAVHDQLCMPSSPFGSDFQITVPFAASRGTFKFAGIVYVIVAVQLLGSNEHTAPYADAVVKSPKESIAMNRSPPSRRVGMGFTYVSFIYFAPVLPAIYRHFFQMMKAGPLFTRLSSERRPCLICVPCKCADTALMQNRRVVAGKVRRVLAVRFLPTPEHGD